MLYAPGSRGIRRKNHLLNELLNEHSMSFVDGFNAFVEGLREARRAELRRYVWLPALVICRRRVLRLLRLLQPLAIWRHCLPLLLLAMWLRAAAAALAAAVCRRGSCWWCHTSPCCRCPWC